MWDFILRMIPYEAIIRFIGKSLVKLDDKAIDYIVQKVEEFDKKHNLTGEEKREQVYRELKENLDNISDWALNLMIELAVSYIKTKKSRR
jgi:hypothetical protein